MKGILIQYGSTFILALLFAMISFSSTWPSYAIKILKSDQSPLGFKISQNEGSLISSIPALGSFISTLIAGYISEALGRKKSQILCGLFYTVAWSLVVTARTTIQLIIARFFMGLSAGVAGVVVLVYISEITQLSIRGSATTMGSLLYNFGVMASYILGWFCSYDVICYTSLTSSVIYVILMTCLKETPSYLLKTGKEKEALSSLKFYRGKSETTEAILEEISYLKSQGKFGAKDSADVEKPVEISEKEKLQNDEKINVGEDVEKKNPWILLFTVRHNRRAITNSVIFVVLTVSMGMVAVQTYAGQFFATAAPTLSPDLCSVLLSLIMVLSSVLTMFVTDLVPRRTLMISTCVVATMCLVILGSVIQWPGAPSWVVLVAIVIYCLAVQLGVINLVFVQLSETFGPQVNSTAVAIVLCFMFLSNFLVLLFFVPAVDNIGIGGSFFVFAGIGAITTVFSYFCMMETRQVPLENVQKMHANGFIYKRVSNIES